MMRIAIMFFALGVTFASVGSVSRADSAAGGDEPDGYRLGQTSMRTFDDDREPGTCGIVLELQRCRDDFATLRKFVGPRDLDAEVAAWLKDGDIDHRIQHWDGVDVQASSWVRDPSFAWWFRSGQLALVSVLPDADSPGNVIGYFVDELNAHPDAAPEKFRNLIDQNPSPAARAKRLVAALALAHPAAPFPSPTITAGNLGYAQLGILNDTLGQLVDNPIALSRPESRRFALMVIDEDEAFDRKAGGKFSFVAVRETLGGAIPGDPEEIDKKLRHPLSNGWIPDTKSMPAQGNAFLLGYLLNQVAYNAAVLKDGPSDKDFRHQLARMKAVDGTPNATTTDLTALNKLPTGQWTAVRKLAMAATLAIMGLPPDRGPIRFELY